MICSSRTALDHNHPISQIVKSINRIKNSSIADKIIAARQLPNRDILVTINTVVIKKKLKHNPT